MYSVIHKRVLTYSWDAERNFKVFVNQNPIVVLEEWSIASIIRIERTRTGVKTLLWRTEYITKSFVIWDSIIYTKYLNWPNGFAWSCVSQKCNLSLDLF